MNVNSSFESFNTPLKMAFVKMIKGINVELSDLGKEKLSKGTGWFFITAINNDETVNIYSQNDFMFENLNLNYLKL